MVAILEPLEIFPHSGSKQTVVPISKIKFSHKNYFKSSFNNSDLLRSCYSSGNNTGLKDTRSWFKS